MKIWRNAVVFYIGGMFYCTVELLWRGWTHGSMFVLGGLCVLCVCEAGRGLPLLWHMLLGTVIVTTLEFLMGLLVNQVWHMGVWDYSDAPMNVLGQICLPFSLLWFVLCGIAIPLEEQLRHALFGTPLPQRRFII